MLLRSRSCRPRSKSPTSRNPSSPKPWRCPRAAPGPGNACSHGSASDLHPDPPGFGAAHAGPAVSPRRTSGADGPPAHDDGPSADDDGPARRGVTPRVAVPSRRAVAPSAAERSDAPAAAANHSPATACCASRRGSCPSTLRQPRWTNCLPLGRRLVVCLDDLPLLTRQCEYYILNFIFSFH